MMDDLKRYIWIGVLGVLLLIGLDYYYQRTNSATNAILLPNAVPLANFSLTDHNSKTIHLKDFENNWLLVFFGYTYCPDICPTSLKYISDELRSLGERAQDIKVLFISVDPERDHPDKIKKYVEYFTDNVIGATGTNEQLQALSKMFGAPFEKQPINKDSQYLVGHSTDFFLVDPQGNWRGVFRPPLEKGKIATDLSALTQKGLF